MVDRFYETLRDNCRISTKAGTTDDNSARDRPDSFCRKLFERMAPIGAILTVGRTLLLVVPVTVTLDDYSAVTVAIIPARCSPRSCS